MVQQPDGAAGLQLVCRQALKCSDIMELVLHAPKRQSRTSFIATDCTHTIMRHGPQPTTPYSRLGETEYRIEHTRLAQERIRREGDVERRVHHAVLLVDSWQAAVGRPGLQCSQR